MSNFIYILSNGDTLQICDSYNVLSVLYFIKQLLTLISIFVPIILIIMSSVDALKAVLSGNVNDEIKKMGNKIVKRIIMCLIFFFVPAIVNLMANIIGFINYDATSCWKNATEENIKALKNKRENTINQAEEEAKKESLEEEEKKKQETENSKNQLKDSINKKEEDKNSSGSVDNTNIATNGKLIFLGDSRTVGLEYVGKGDEGVSFVCEGGMGYNWFINTAISKVNQIATTDGYTILFNLGINGTVKKDGINTQEADGYVSKIKELANGDWSKHKIVIVSLFPVDDAHNKYQLNDAGAVAFNNYMKENLVGKANNISYCDVYNGLTDKSAYSTSDGLHYAPDGYKKIYNYMKENCK